MNRHRPRGRQGPRRSGKDLDDVAALLAAGDVDEAEVEDLLGQLEAALGQSDLRSAFAAVRARR